MASDGSNQHLYASNNLVQDFNKLQSEKLWGQEVIEEESDAYYQPIFVLNSTDDVEAFKPVRYCRNTTASLPIRINTSRSPVVLLV